MTGDADGAGGVNPPDAGPAGRAAGGRAAAAIGRALHIHVRGPWPFITLRSYALAGRHFVWHARADRKGLEGSARAQAAGPVWRRPIYNHSIAALFALGSLLFMLGAALSLLPAGAGPPAAAPAAW